MATVELSIAERPILMRSNISGAVNVNAVDQKTDVSRLFMSTMERQSAKLTHTLVHKYVYGARMPD